MKENEVLNEKGPIEPDIKIFVSHRIDLDSETVENPIYYPVRCGAIYDRRENVYMPGDNTGDNISEKRMSFCEFTVQYWAWKNIEADYYGMCHYRRYLSFSEKQFKAREYLMVQAPFISPFYEKKFGLLDVETMRNMITAHDVVVSEYAPVKTIPAPGGKQKTVRELWEAHDGEFIDKEVINVMFDLIDELAPEYSSSAREYFNGALHRGFNCFVMKKELFDRMCCFQFPILFALEARLDTTGYTDTMKRTPGFVGEMLYGIFVYHISTYEDWNVGTRQMVYFAETKKLKGKIDTYLRFLRYYSVRFLKYAISFILPPGSKQRRFIKQLISKEER